MLKRISAMILCIVLAVPFFAFSSSAEGTFSVGSYLVTDKKGALIYPTAEASLDYNAIAPEGAYLNVITVKGNFGYTTYNAVYGWVDLTDGTEYVSSKPAVTDKNKIEGAKGIKVTRLPSATEFVEGEDSADISGLEVSLVFNDDKSSTMPVKGYTVAFPDLDTYGRKEVKIYYGGFSTTYMINVVKVPVTGIVITRPFKTTFIEGEAVSFEGLEVSAYFSDGRDSGAGIKLSPEEYTLSGVKEGTTTLKPGTYPVTVTYKYPEITASFNIYVSGKAVKTLKLQKLPSALVLYQGQKFNNSDFELVATYDNGTSEKITDFDIQCDNMQLGLHTARIYYMDKYVAFEYEVRELEQTGIALGDTSNVGSYAGDSPDFSRLKVYNVYNSGEKKLTEDYELSHEIDINTIGKYKVTVTQGEYTAEFEYTVAKRAEIRAGDIDFNGKVNAIDARLALRCSAQIEKLSEDAFLAADVDLDGKVTALDARKILRVSAGLDVL